MASLPLNRHQSRCAYKNANETLSNLDPFVCMFVCSCNLFFIDNEHTSVVEGKKTLHFLRRSHPLIKGSAKEISWNSNVSALDYTDNT